MKTRLTTLHNGSSPRATNGPVPGMKPVLALLIRLLWTTALLLAAFGAQAGAVLTTLYSLQAISLYDGADPYAGLVQGKDGNLYGTTPVGGGVGYGTVFKISTSGAYTNLYSFTDANDGWLPLAQLVQGNDGYLYGTTAGGGTNNDGTVFKISTNGSLISLHSFVGTNDGLNPQAGLVQGDGYFYGTAPGGGTNNSGTVFKITANGALTSLHSFTGTNDGATPTAALVQGSDGYLYGMTVYGGKYGYGTVFKISTTGALTNLHSFTGPGNNDPNPYGDGGLVQGSDGYLYGTKAHEGNFGTVFKISTNGAYTSLYSFINTT